jgi:hypothetical protein
VYTLPIGAVCTSDVECASGYCYRDADADGYAASSGDKICKTTASLGADCYDLNASAKPGQTSYFTVHRGDGSFDYNCNSVTDKTSGCSGNTCTNGAVFPPPCTSTIYFQGVGVYAYTPSCGQTWTSGASETTQIPTVQQCYSYPPYGSYCLCNIGLTNAWKCNYTTVTCSCR